MRTKASNILLLFLMLIVLMIVLNVFSNFEVVIRLKKKSDDTDHAVVHSTEAVEYNPAKTVVVAKTPFDKCEHLEGLKDEQVFLPVDNGRHSFVCSALWDNVDKEEQKIRIVGITLFEEKISDMYCYFQDKPSRRCRKVMAKVVKAFYSGGQRYVPCVFFCPLPPRTIPGGVSLMTSASGPLYNELTILNDGMDQQPEYQFTVCLSPLQNGYNNTLQLIHFIQMNQILGADFFVFYNTSMSKYMEAILLGLVEEGLALIIQWQMPVRYVFYAAQDSALNDCMNRMIYRTKYIVVTDLDEFIIPRNHMNWHELMNDTQRACPLCESFKAKVAFFGCEHANHSFNFPERNIAETYQIIPLLNLERITNVPGPFQITKYIYDPRGGETLDTLGGNFRKNTRDMQFSDDQVLFHHYRERVTVKLEFEPEHCH